MSFVRPRLMISLDGNGAAIRHRLNGVSEESHEQLDDLPWIALDPRQLVGTPQFNLHMLFLSGWGVDRDNVVKQWRERHNAELAPLARRHQAEAISETHNSRNLHGENADSRV